MGRTRARGRRRISGAWPVERRWWRQPSRVQRRARRKWRGDRGAVVVSRVLGGRSSHASTWAAEGVLLECLPTARVSLAARPSRSHGRSSVPPRAECVRAVRAMACAPYATRLRRAPGRQTQPATDGVRSARPPKPQAVLATPSLQLHRIQYGGMQALCRTAGAAGRSSDERPDRVRHGPSSFDSALFDAGVRGGRGLDGSTGVRLGRRTAPTSSP